MLSLPKHPAVRRIGAFRYARSFDFAQDDSLGGAPTPEAKTNSECSYKRNVFIRSERSQSERRDKRRARRFVQVSKCVLFFALAHEWHNECTILIYASADCLPRWSRKAATVSSVGLDVKYKRLRHVVA